MGVARDKSEGEDRVFSRRMLEREHATVGEGAIASVTSTIGS
jgi:hypothetical protein